jgi:type VI secretion system secreted protein Hcp
MAFDAFMKIASIPGESGDESHANWIELESFQWGISNGAVMGSQPTTDRRTVGTGMTFCKSVDVATPLMVHACNQGTLLPEVKIEVCRATKDKQNYMENTLKTAFITWFETAAKASRDLPVDRVEIVMDSFKLEYIQTDHKSGKSKGGSETTIDFRRGS